MGYFLKKKKKTYLLLELLIAFFLLSLFLAPMLGSPLSYIRKQVQSMTSIYLELEAEKYLALIEEKVRTHKVSWHQIVESQKKTILLDTISFKVPSHKKTEDYEARLFLYKTHLQTQEQSSYGTIKGLVRIYKLKPKKKKEYEAHLNLFVVKKEMTPPDQDTQKEAL